MVKKTSTRRFSLAAERDDEASKSQEMYTEVGRTVVQLSNIEDELSSIYYSIIDYRLDTVSAMAPFYAQPWFEGKILLVDLLIRLEESEDVLRRWEKIIKELKQHRAVRNLVAHQPLYAGFPDRDGRVNVSLQPAQLHSRYDSKRKRIVPIKGRPISLAEVRSSASALERMRKDLHDLWMMLEESRLPAEQRSDYVDPED